MSNDLPTYLPGDTIRLRLQLQHDAKIGDAWASFRMREPEPGGVQEPGGVHRPTFGLDIVDIQEIERVGTRITSEVVLEAPVSQARPTPGEYELETLRGHPFGVQRSRDAEGIEFSPTPVELRLRIAEDPVRPTMRLTSWRLERA